MTTDAEIAVEVMGWELFNKHPYYNQCKCVWKPLANISQAFQVDDKVHSETGFELMLLRRSDGNFTACHVDKDGLPVTDWMHDKNPATSICKAALAAIRDNKEAP